MKTTIVRAWVRRETNYVAQYAERQDGALFVRVLVFGRKSPWTKTVREEIHPSAIEVDVGETKGWRIPKK